MYLLKTIKDIWKLLILIHQDVNGRNGCDEGTDGGKGNETDIDHGDGSGTTATTFSKAILWAASSLSQPVMPLPFSDCRSLSLTAPPKLPLRGH